MAPRAEGSRPGAWWPVLSWLEKQAGRAPGQEFDRIVDPTAMTGDTGHLVM
jgi:hypothetical protein